MAPQGRLIMLLVEIAPFAVLFVLYALLAYPLYLKKKIWWHAIVSVLLLVLFGLWIFTLGRHAPAGPGPGGFGPGGAGFGNPGAPPEFSQGPPPPPFGAGPDEPVGGAQGGPGLFGRFRPEFTKLFIALMMLMVERGFWDWLRSRSRRRKGTADAASVEERPDSASPGAPPSDDLVIKFARKTVTIPLDSIIYIESMSEYVKFHLEEPAEAVVVLGSLKKLMEMLPADRFIRIHRTYIVATDRIRETGAASVTLDGGLRLPVGDSFRPALKAWSARK